MTEKRIAETFDAYCNGKCEKCMLDSACRWQTDEVLRHDTDMVERLMRIAFEPYGEEKNILKLIAIESERLTDETLSKKAYKRLATRIGGMMAAYTALTGVVIGLDAYDRQIFERHSDIVIFEWDFDGDDAA